MALPHSSDAKFTNLRESTNEGQKNYKNIFPSKNDGDPQNLQPIRNRASPIMTLGTGKGSPRSFSLPLLNIRSMVKNSLYTSSHTLVKYWFHTNQWDVAKWSHLGKRHSRLKFLQEKPSSPAWRWLPCLCQRIHTNHIVSGSQAVGVRAEIGNEDLLIGCVYHPLVLFKATFWW